MRNFGLTIVGIDLLNEAQVGELLDGLAVRMHAQVPLCAPT